MLANQNDSRMLIQIMFVLPDINNKHGLLQLRERPASHIRAHTGVGPSAQYARQGLLPAHRVGPTYARYSTS